MYKCQECSIEFKTKRSLSNHIRIHKKYSKEIRKIIINDYVNNKMTYREITGV